MVRNKSLLITRSYNLFTRGWELHVLAISRHRARGLLGSRQTTSLLGYVGKHDFSYTIRISRKMILKIFIKDNLLKYLVDVLKLANKTCERKFVGAIGHSDRCINELVLLKGCFMFLFVACISYVHWTLLVYCLSSKILYQCIVEDKPTNFPSFFAVYFDLTTKEKGNEWANLLSWVHCYM